MKELTELLDALDEMANDHANYNGGYPPEVNLVGHIVVSGENENGPDVSIYELDDALKRFENAKQLHASGKEDSLISAMRECGLLV